MTLPPAGWYPDPTSPAEVRWWDGAQWTGHTHRPDPGPRTDDGAPLAGWWQRVGAYVIDSLLTSVVGLPATLPLQIELQSRLRPLTDRLNASVAAGRPPNLDAYFRDFGNAVYPLMVTSLLIGLAVWATYVAVCLRWKGRTVGMTSLGIGVRTVEPTEGPLPWGVIARRIAGQQGPLLLMLVPGLLFVAGTTVVALWGLLDSLWPLGDRRNQTLHDKIAGTLVVQRR